MFAASDPDMIVAQIAIGGLVLAGRWRLVVWVRDAPTRPDPWDAETEQKLSEPEAVEVCHHCFTPQPTTAWFCEHCGSAVGPYNNLMPYVCIFSQGEVLRNGVHGRFRNKPVVLIGYFLISIGILALLAPVYWFFLLSNLARPADAQESTEEQEVQ